MTDTLKTTLSLIGGDTSQDLFDYIVNLFDNDKRERARTIFGTLSRDEQIEAMCYYASCFGGSPEFTGFIAYLSNK